MTKSRELDEVETPCYFVNRRHYGEDVKIFQEKSLYSHYLVDLLKYIA